MSQDIAKVYPGPSHTRLLFIAVDPGPVMYANERVICEEDLPKFYVCSTTGGERTFAAVESKALPRKSQPVMDCVLFQMALLCF